MKVAYLLSSFSRQVRALCPVLWQILHLRAGAISVALALGTRTLSGGDDWRLVIGPCERGEAGKGHVKSFDSSSEQYSLICSYRYHCLSRSRPFGGIISGNSVASLGDQHCFVSFSAFRQLKSTTFTVWPFLQYHKTWHITKVWQLSEIMYWLIIPFLLLWATNWWYDFRINWNEWSQHLATKPHLQLSCDFRRVVHCFNSLPR